MTTDRAYVTGRLLVANPEMGDANFDRAVVFVIEHDAEGALGVVLNNPLGTSIDETLQPWSTIVAEPASLFLGGPVATDALLGLAVADPVDPPAGFLPALGSIGTIDLTGQPEAFSPGRVRVFSGYSGWGAGQLDAELAHSAWHVVGADPADILTPDPDDLWSAVLARQRGPLRILAHYPDHPRLN